MSIQVAPQITALVETLSKLPGIGPRSAQRIVFHLLNNDEDLLNVLITELSAAKEGLRRCTCCNTLTDRELCEVCSDTSRDASLLCVVESVADQMAIDASLSWPGRYFVLNGRLNPLEGQGPYEIGFDTLLERIAERLESLREVVVATSYTPEGDATAYFLVDNLKKRWPELKVTRLARGLPSGVEIEYTDLNSIANAVYSRSEP